MNVIIGLDGKSRVADEQYERWFPVFRIACRIMATDSGDKDFAQKVLKAIMTDPTIPRMTYQANGIVFHSCLD